MKAEKGRDEREWRREGDDGWAGKSGTSRQLDARLLRLAVVVADGRDIVIVDEAVVLVREVVAVASIVVVVLHVEARHELVAGACAAVSPVPERSCCGQGNDYEDPCNEASVIAEKKERRERRGEAGMNTSNFKEGLSSTPIRSSTVVRVAFCPRVTICTLVAVLSCKIGWAHITCFAIPVSDTLADT